MTAHAGIGLHSCANVAVEEPNYLLVVLIAIAVSLIVNLIISR